LGIDGNDPKIGKWSRQGLPCKKLGSALLLTAGVACYFFPGKLADIAVRFFISHGFYGFPDPAGKARVKALSDTVKNNEQKGNKPGSHIPAPGAYDGSRTRAPRPEGLPPYRGLVGA
jgi:hypothetical protein